MYIFSLFNSWNRQGVYFHKLALDLITASVWEWILISKQLTYSGTRHSTLRLASLESVLYRKLLYRNIL